MIQKYISDLAAKMGIELTKIDLVDGKSVGCLDVYLVKISAHSHETAVLVYNLHSRFIVTRQAELRP